MSGPMAAMGKPVSFLARQAAYDACKEMGLEHSNAMSAVNRMADNLERDRPFEAMDAVKELVDLTGSYRLMATLLAFSPPADKEGRK